MAIPAPMPRLAPVTSATRFFKSLMASFYVQACAPLRRELSRPLTLVVLLCTLSGDRRHNAVQLQVLRQSAEYLLSSCSQKHNSHSRKDEQLISPPPLARSTAATLQQELTS